MKYSVQKLNSRQAQIIKSSPQIGVRMYSDWFHNPPAYCETCVSAVFRYNDRYGIFLEVLAGNAMGVGKHMACNLNDQDRTLYYHVN
jgi:hypothetical protein